MGVKNRTYMYIYIYMRILTFFFDESLHHLVYTGGNARTPPYRE